MKIIVTHASPDWDAIGSVWILKKYLPGWENAQVFFVPAGQRHPKSIGSDGENEVGLEVVGEDEMLHVDTGLGKLDHHHTGDKNISAAGLCWTYIKSQIAIGKIQLGSGERLKDREEAIDRVIKFIVDTDHFKEVFWTDPAADYHEFTILGLLDGMKFLKPNEDDYYVQWGREILDAMVHTFENRVWAEREIKENGKAFHTRWGKAVGFETINDGVIKLAQKMGYMLVVRKDPRKGYVRIKARPVEDLQPGDIDLTPAYEKFSQIDPHATWFLHASKKMLLNGTPKNPKMIPTKLTLDEIVEVLKKI